MSELSPGTVLSRYRIINRIGAGGMGEVYRAQDIELGRSVALKFLSGELSARESKLSRFIQEAKAASSLNHPNIITVHEIGRSNDHTFIATEFVEGLTLRQTMRLERLKLIEILDLATQIASALVAAHAAGIVHRDIKPENIMVRTDGIVKILDFGLAKLIETPSMSTGPEESTVAMVNTEPGTVIGTTAYMSPEQAVGRDVDARTDIWSLGVVLYEMITARAPFTGASKSHVIVAITDQEPPPLTQFAPDIPQALEWIVAEALTKDPDERCQTAKEMLGKLRRLKQRVESGALPTSPSDLNRSTAPPSSTGPLVSNLTTLTEDARSTAPSGDPSVTQAIARVEPRSQLRFFAALGFGLFIFCAIAIGLYKLLNQPKQFAPIRMSALTTGGKIGGEDINGQLSISPDGKYVVCAANDIRQLASLWIRQVSTNSLVRLVPPENGAYLSTTFSPDGEFIYYVASLEKNKFVPTLYRIPVLGGSPAKILERVDSAIGFSKDGAQFAFVRQDQDVSSLIVASSDGTGDRMIVSEKHPNQFSTSGPAWSPDGKRIAVGLHNGDKAAVVEVTLAGGQRKQIGSEEWASVGRLMWLGDGSGLIMAAQTGSGSIGTQIWLLPYPNGASRRITNDLNGYGEVSLGVTADAGTIATIQQVNSSSIWITVPNEDESRALPILKTNLPETVAWAPDGRVVYSSRTGENWDIWISNSDGSQSKQLTSDAFIEHQPTVSPDGRFVVFQSNRSGNRNLWRMDLDGSNPKQLTSGDFEDSSPVCSPDGRFVIFQSTRSGALMIWKIGIEGGSPTQLTDTLARLPSISPEGKLVSYFYEDTRANNQPKLGIISIDGGELVKSVELPRSVQPIAFAWLPDGKSIAYLDNASGILNVWCTAIDGGARKQLTNFRSQFITSFAISRVGTIASYRWSATRDIVLIKDFR